MAASLEQSRTYRFREFRDRRSRQDRRFDGQKAAHYRELSGPGNNVGLVRVIYEERSIREISVREEVAVLIETEQ
jgi:hypothetical protein